MTRKQFISLITLLGVAPKLRADDEFEAAAERFNTPPMELGKVTIKGSDLHAVLTKEDKRWLVRRQIDLKEFKERYGNS